jgi:hypothetical protein
MTKAGQVSSALIPTAPLLLTESKDEFNLIRDTLNEQIKPRGIIEQMYVEDIAYLVWEILRLRRAGCHAIYLSLQSQVCLHRSRTAQPKPSGGPCRSYSSSTDTSEVQPPAAIGPQAL